MKCVKERALKRAISSLDGNESEIPKTKRASPGYTSHTKNMAEVEEILEKLTHKHQDNYTPEQLHAWAHMIQMKKHSSCDTVPSKPFFGKKGVLSAGVSGISPLKKINMRSECVQVFVIGTIQIMQCIYIAKKYVVILTVILVIWVAASGGLVSFGML